MCNKSSFAVIKINIVYYGVVPLSATTQLHQQLYKNLIQYNVYLFIDSFTSLFSYL